MPRGIPDWFITLAFSALTALFIHGPVSLHAAEDEPPPPRPFEAPPEQPNPQLPPVPPRPPGPDNPNNPIIPPNPNSPNNPETPAGEPPAPAQEPQQFGPPVPLAGPPRPTPPTPSAPEVSITPAPRTANAPGSVYQLEFLTPGGLRSPSDLVITAPKPLPTSPEHGFNFGAVKIYPGMSYDLTYTDNSLRTETHRKKDGLEEFGPNVALSAHPDEHIKIDLAYAFLWHDYVNNTAKDYFSHSGVGTIALRSILLDQLNFTFGDTYLQTGNTNVLETEILSFSRFATNKAFGSVDYTQGHFKIAARYDFDNLSYFEHPQSASNVHDQSGTLDLGYQLSEVFQLFSTYSILRTYHDTVTAGFPKDEDRHTAEVGMVAKFDHFTFSGAGGYTASQIIYDGPQDDGAVASASMNYRYNEHLDFGGYTGLGISQNAREGRIVGQSRDLLLTGQGGEPISFGAYVNYRPWQHVRISTNIDKTTSQGILTGSTRDLLYGGSAQLILTERAHVEGTVFQDVSRGSGNTRLTVNSFSANATYSFRRATLLLSLTRTDNINDHTQHRNDTDEARLGFRFAW